MDEGQVEAVPRRGEGLAHLGLQSANQTFPRITDLISLSGKQLERPVRIESFAESEETQAAAEQLKTLFDQFGSDKARSHYHLLYGAILSEPNRITDLDELAASIAPAFDLIIDDGLHAPDANIATLTFGLPKLKTGGWLVVEDIPYPTAASSRFVKPNASALRVVRQYE